MAGSRLCEGNKIKARDNTGTAIAYYFGVTIK